MPFGAIFGALFFGLFSLWLVFATIETSAGSLMVPRLFLAVVSLSLGLALLLRRRWARWAGVAFTSLLAVLMLRLAMAGSGVAPFLFFFGALTNVGLLLFPGTGAVRPPRPAPAPAFGRLLAWGSTICALGFAASLSFLELPANVPITTMNTEEGRARQVGLATDRLHWSDYATGVERASVEGRAVLANFTANWCGYCKKMDRTTWKSPAVIDRLAGIVPVRVDVDETRPRNGQAGAELAARYGVQGTPTLILLDPDGQVIDRASGYLDSRQLLEWLDRTLGRPADGESVDTMQVSSP
jgi:thioredoxin-related protein